MAIQMTKEMTETMIRDAVRTRVAQFVFEALQGGEFEDVQNLRLVSGSDKKSAKNTIGVIADRVEKDGTETPVSVTVDITVKPFVDKKTDKKTTKVFDFAGAKAAYDKWLADRAAKEKEKATKE